MTDAPHTRTPLDRLLAALEPLEGGGHSVHVPPDWMQGRTLYGGISAALCLAHVRRAHDGLPPLRSAQVAFVGPASGDVELRSRILRQGKSATFLTADLTSEAGHGTHALFCFGAERPSAYRLARFPAPVAPAPDGAPDHFAHGGPAFKQHFDVRIVGGARPVSGAAEADVLLWLRPLDPGAEPFEALLLAMADVPPPAAMSLFTQPAPISTMTWMVDCLAPGHRSPDGWYLLRSTADVTAGGYSAQSMALWASDGVPLVAGRQCVALFG
jgi:hypothetical protein